MQRQRTSLRHLPRSARTLTTLGVILAALVYALVNGAPPLWSDTAPAADDSSVVLLYQEQRSGEMVEGTGTVERVLPDDHDGSKHQRFIIALDSGHTLLVSHNIDLASRLDDLQVGDQVDFRGQYEWNDRGGVLHWTHHDPNGRRPGGWLEHHGATYR